MESKEFVIDQLLDVYKNEQNVELQDNPTFFSILGRSYDEDLISRMLAYILKNDYKFVWSLLNFYWTESLGVCPKDFTVESVECEKSMLNGRADIFLIAHDAEKNYTLTIENKIYSWEHDEQTKTYFKFVDLNFPGSEYQNAYLFLKPKFNASPVSCEKFKTILYNDLIDKLGETDDYIVNDVKKHIKEYLTVKTIKLTDTDRKVIENLSELRTILSTTEDKLSNFKRQLFNELCSGKIEGLSYNPYAYKELKQNDKDEYWNKYKNGKLLVVEIADNETSFRIYRADEWYGDGGEDGFYFYVELKFKENDPKIIEFQKVVKRYGNREDRSIVKKFLDSEALGISGENPITWKKEGQYYVFSNKIFPAEQYEILSPEWGDKLLSFAKTTLTEDIAEMEIIFKKFKEWSKNKS